MLITCPECGLKISDKAISCPHCGYPLKEEKRPYISRKRKRLPNGFGQITELKGRNLRNPFRAMITTGKDQHGKPISKLLKPKAYFKTYNEAYEALINQHKKPYDENKNITMDALFLKWSEEKYKKVSTSRVNTIKSAWDYCSEIYNVKVSDIRSHHIRWCINNGTAFRNGKLVNPSPATGVQIKTVFRQLLNYAIEYDIIDTNYAAQLSLDNNYTVTKTADPFNDDELKTMWNNQSEYISKMILIQCYTGFRPKELCELKIANISLAEGTIIGGIKTKAGKNRIVPIHSRISDMVEDCYNKSKDMGSEYLFTRSNKVAYNYIAYKRNFEKFLLENNLDPNHRPHDARKTFVTRAKEYNLDEYAIKYIVGHAIEDITERVYTKRNIEWLKNEIKKIK